jgi:hypothetical protein
MESVTITISDHTGDHVYRIEDPTTVEFFRKQNRRKANQSVLYNILGSDLTDVPARLPAAVANRVRLIETALIPADLERYRAGVMSAREQIDAAIRYVFKKHVEEGHTLLNGRIPNHLGVGSRAVKKNLSDAEFQKFKSIRDLPLRTDTVAVYSTILDTCEGRHQLYARIDLPLLGLPLTIDIAI